MDIASRNALVTAHLDVADRVVRIAIAKYHSIDAEEARQVALLAMLECVDGYDPARGAFAPYAGKVALNAVRESLGIHRAGGGKARGRQELLLSTRMARGMSETDVDLVITHMADGRTPETLLDHAEQERIAATGRFDHDERLVLRAVLESDGALRGQALASATGLTVQQAGAALARVAHIIAGITRAPRAAASPPATSGAARTRAWFARLSPEKRDERRGRRRARELAKRQARQGIVAEAA